MKALKEKRISLRSLWRRGLVILSLFALVFASCGDSSSSDDTTTTSGGGVDTGPGILKVEVKDHPGKDQYLGQPINLEGMSVTVYYYDGTKEVVEYSNGNFLATPRVYTGAYTGTGFTGLPTCQVTYKNKIAEANLTGGAWGIVRTDAKSYGTIDGALWGVDDENYSMGLNLTGSAAKTAYVDQDSFDFSGLRLEAEYFKIVDPTTTPAKVDRAKKQVSFGDITYKIMPSYDDIGEDRESKGYVAITVGDDYDDLMGLKYLNNGVSSGVTTSWMLDSVYLVKSISLYDEKDFGDYFYWDDNSKDAWVERLGDKAKLKVTYSNGSSDDKYVEDLARAARIWWNTKPELGIGTPNTQSGRVRGVDDFDIAPIQYPLLTKYNEKPGIVIYYRGAWTKKDVHVFTKLVDIDPQPAAKDGQAIAFDPAATSDNDLREGMTGARGLAAKLYVTATYAAYDDESVTSQPVELTYIGLVRDALGLSPGMTPVPGKKYIPYYFFDKTGGDATYNAAYDKWSSATDKAKSGVDSIDRQVTVAHSAPESDFYDYTNGAPPASYYEPTWTAMGTNNSRFQDGSSATGAYIFAGAPEFYHNLKRKPSDPSAPGARDRVRGWEWVPNPLNLATQSGSGLKPAKAMAKKIMVTWLITDKMDEM